MKRKAALFDQKWPTEFSTMVERKWQMCIGHPTNRQTVMHVSYHGTELSVTQRNSFIRFLLSRTTSYMHNWLGESATRLVNDALTLSWAQEQPFCKDMASECGLRISTVFNFPTDNEELPDSHYPLAFIITSA